MDFLDYLKTTAEEINQELDHFFKEWNKEVETVSPKLVDLNKHLVEASEGGKRLRGALVKLGYEMGKEKSEGLRGVEGLGGLDKEILKAAAAFEIFQTAILAHDDIIDKSPTRRGKPTIYQALGGNHYGISQTICLGDIGYFLAVRLISQSNFPALRKSKAMSFFAQGMLETALGQMLDVELPYRDEPKEEVDALTIFRLKTARYTIVGPLQLGAILGGAKQTLLREIREFGESLGIAFQIQDDILGVFGEEDELGKSVTSDIEEGKNTLLIIRALQNADGQQKAVLERLYGKGKVDKEGLEEIRQVFKETKALEYSQKKAGELVAQAKKVIGEMGEIGEEHKKILTQMADFLVERNK